MLMGVMMFLAGSLMEVVDSTDADAVDTKKAIVTAEIALSNSTSTSSYALYFLSQTGAANPNGNLVNDVSFFKAMFLYISKLILYVLENALIAVILFTLIYRRNGRFVMWKLVSEVELMILVLLLGRYVGAFEMVESQEIIE